MKVVQIDPKIVYELKPTPKNSPKGPQKRFKITPKFKDSEHKKSNKMKVISLLGKLQKLLRPNLKPPKKSLIEPKRLKISHKKQKNQKVRKQKLLQNESHQSICCLLTDLNICPY